MCQSCEEDPKPNQYETDILTVPLHHFSIKVRNCNTEAQAYVSECNLTPEESQHTEEELGQDTSGTGTTGKVPELSTRLQAAAEEIRLIKENGEPDDTKLGLGEVEMQEQDQLQSNLQNLTQRMVHVVQACNEENGLLQDEFIAVPYHSEIWETQILTEHAMLDAEVSGVGGQMPIQQVVIKEMRQGITILQKQYYIRITEAREMLQGINKEIHNSQKNQVDKGSTLLNHQKSILKLQDDF